MTEDSKLYRTLGPIYISSIQPLFDNEDLFAKYKIKTIISITKSDIPEIYKNTPYTQESIPIDDASEEVIIPYIPKVNKLIFTTIYNEGSGKPTLSGNSVLVHCQSGISRSVAFVCAYLMNRHNLTVDYALHAIRRNYPERTFQPNDGFIQQLQIYKESEWCVDLIKLRKVSARWRAYRMEFLMFNKHKSIDEFSTVEENSIDENWFGIKCSKCRSLLTSSEVFIPHSPPFEKDDKQLYFTKTVYKRKRVIDRQVGSECTHIFTEPLVWMNETITGTEDLEGRLDCYKCHAKVGGWNWKGGRCSCGKWMVPAIHLLKSKIIQVDKNNKLILPNDERSI